jgi:transcription elongation GreA/GreB family factor
MQSLTDDQAGETKSSAGDKYETSREMMAQQLEQLWFQLRNAEKQLAELGQIERITPLAQIAYGSLVVLQNGAVYLLGLAVGKVEYAHGKHVIGISLESPFGQHLIGKTEGEQISFRTESHSIVSIG